jgi:hypothetical protein
MSANAKLPDLVRAELPANVTYAGWALFWLGIILTAAAYLFEPTRASFNNVIGYLFLVSLAVGALFLLALEYISGAVWSVPMRRVTEAVAGIMPFVPLTAVPMFFHLHDLFHWMNVEAVENDVLLSSKTPYLNEEFFFIRFIVFSALWIFFWWLFTRRSLRQDRTRDQKDTTANIRLAAAFLPVFGITLTFTAIDWAMSLEAHWFSTIYGVYYFSGTVLAAVAAVTIIVVQLSERGLLPNITRNHLYSLGALLFAFVNFWAYIAFSQFLLVWYANLPEETYWFIARWQNGWEVVSILLIIVHFAVPYIVLLSQDAKMDPRRLKFMAVWILFAHFLDLYWLVMPTFSKTPVFGWTELAWPVFIAGLVISVLAFKMKRHNIVPIGDPKLERGLGFRI